MSHSTVTRKGQTTIPGKIRKALQIKPGDKLQYAVEGDHATIRVHPGTRIAEGCASQQEGQENEFRRNPRSRREGSPRPREYPVSAKRRLVDANIIVRYLVQDHEKHAKAAGKLFEACDRGDVEIVVLPAVLGRVCVCAGVFL